MVSKRNISRELGIAIRDKIRSNGTIIAGNSGVDPENWIFLGRPKDLNDKTFPLPRIIVEQVDQVRGPYSVDNKKEILIPYVFHMWLDKEESGAYDAFDYQDTLGDIADNDVNDIDGVEQSEVTSSFITDDEQDTKKIDHITVTDTVLWREI